MLDEKFQGCPLVAADPKLGNLSLNLVKIHHHGRAGGGRDDTGDDEIRIDQLVNDDVGGAGLGNIGRQIGKKLLQIRFIRRHRHMGSVRVCGPIVEDIDVNAV